MQTTTNQNLLQAPAEVRAGEHDRRARAKAERGKDAGSVHSSAMGATEDAARRRLAAASAGGGAPERTSAGARGTTSIDWTSAAGTCTGKSEADVGNCKVTMSEAHELVAKLE